MGGWLNPISNGVRTDLIQLQDHGYDLTVYWAAKACVHNKPRPRKENKKIILTTPFSIYGFTGEVPGLQGKNLFTKFNDVGQWNAAWDRLSRER
jgi:hypothetical protein